MRLRGADFAAMRMVSMSRRIFVGCVLPCRKNIHSWWMMSFWKTSVSRTRKTPIISVASSQREHRATRCVFSRLTSVLVIAFVATVDGQGGQPFDQKPAFEVASVKPSTSRDTAMRIIWPRGRFSAVNVTMHQFIENAYKIEPFRIDGGPGWIAADRFNIDATIPADAVVVQARWMPDAIRLMMQRLLADRFRFVTHLEQKQQTIYALVMARPNGPLGPGVRQSHADCAALFAAARQGGPPPPSSLCGVQRAPGRLVATGYLMAQLADILASSIQQVVVDHTELRGLYDIDLTWAADQTDSGPSLFTALQEQLGLKLQPTKAAVDVLVIDHVEKPSPD